MIPFSLASVCAFEFLEQELLLDLDISPRLYVYALPRGGYNDYHFIREDGTDNGENRLTAREFQFSPSLDGISLNSTPFFYPEQEIDPNFHANAEMHTFLQPPVRLTLPGMEYKQCRLHLLAGFSLSANQPGLTLSVYARKPDGSRVYMTSLYENYLSGSIKVSASPIVFESAVYNQSLDFIIPDLDFIFSSNDADIIDLRNKIFGGYRPQTLFFEFSLLTPDNIDSIIVSSKQYVKLNISNLNSFQYDISAANLDLYVDLRSLDGYLTSEIKHTRFAVEQYLAKFKQFNETYSVKHKFTVNLFDSMSVLSGTLSATIENTLDTFDNVTYRPVIQVAAVDHMEVNVEVDVVNDVTGSIIRRAARVIVTDVAKYDPDSSLLAVSLTVDQLTNNVTDAVNQILIDADAPKIVQIEKPTFVLLQTQADTITLLPYDNAIKITANIPDVNAVEISKLRIGALSIPNNGVDKTSFTVPKQAYYLDESKYFIVDQNDKIINYGKIIKG